MYRYVHCIPDMCIQWNPSCGAIPFASDMWPFKRSGLSLVEINTVLSLAIHHLALWKSNLSVAKNHN